MNRLYVVLLVALGVTVTGCGSLGTGSARAAVPAATAAPTTCRQARRVVVGIDRTGSYQLAHEGLAQIATIVEQAACPGDLWLLRWIEENSFSPQAAIDSVSLPAVPPRPTQRMQLSERLRYRRELQVWTTRVVAFANGRKQLAQEIQGLPVTPASATDIAGFLAKAGELLANTPPGTAPVIIIVSDFLDTVGRDVPFDFHGADVLVLAFEAEDPAAGVRDQWEGRLQRANAGAVYFRDVSEPVSDLPGALALSTYPK